MRILHVFADWKWTGPAAPTVELCSEFARRGARVVLACQEPERREDSLPERAAKEGIEVLTDLVPKLATPGRIRKLGSFISDKHFDVVHVHQSRDHLLGGLASRGKAPVVRTNHSGLPIRNRPGEFLLYRKLTDGYFTFTRRGLEEDLRRYPALKPRSRWAPPGMRLDAYRTLGRTREVRRRLGLTPDHFLFGVVARVQKHRRFDVLLEAFRRLRVKVPHARLAIAGRGTRIQEIAKDPVRLLGLSDRVVFPGYLREDYLPFVADLDAYIYLMPGSDGTCRALREAMLLQRPVAAFDVGMISELLAEGRAGLLVEPDPDALATALMRLADDADLRRSLGVCARRFALASFDIKTLADAFEILYRDVISQRH